MQRPLAVAIALLAGCATSRPSTDQAPASRSDSAGNAAPAAAREGRPSYPPTRKVEAKDVLHGVTVTDPYRWLEDAKSPEVTSWMGAQDALARARLNAMPGRDAIADRLRQLLYYDALEAPIHRGTRYFYTRRLASKEKAIVYLREGRDGTERVLLDPNTWTKDGSEGLGGWWPSWDGKRVAFKIRHNNSDETTTYVLDADTLERSKVDVIDGTKYAGASWTPAGDGFYYTWIPPPGSVPVADRPGEQVIKFHRLGEDPVKDRVVVEKIGDPTTFQNVELSIDGHWLVRTVSHGWRSTDVSFRDARSAGSPWTTLVSGQDSIYDLDVFRDRFYVNTNEGAPNRRVFAVDPAHPDRGSWREIIPERKDATLESASLVGGKLAVVYLKDVLSRVEIRDLDGKLARELPLPELGSASGLVGRPDEDEAYFSFESFTVPDTIYRTSVAQGGMEVFFRLQVPVDSSRYATEQLFATSKDGTKVPVFLVRAKGQKPDKNTPALLTGYGGFLISERPRFRPAIFPWLERGGVFALAVLRGGGEYGEEWHRAGMLTRKQNVFDDFIAASEKLVADGWTSSPKLAILGGSNGGLLVSAAEVQRPDLYGAILCGVPLIDMVRYHLFGSGKTWISEYGSADDAEQFKAILAYSPMQHVKQGVRYPATLLLSADADDRVDPMHARKFAAELQEASTGGPVLLRIERHSGHGGSDQIKATIDRTADEYAFALSAMGASEPARTAKAR
ncbi:MAG: S9 family peptidase [Deltaproteobacteria bacterium]|nr:MAG: S9 family peptidase [Deltaproteobacteria bacterium]